MNFWFAQHQCDLKKKHPQHENLGSGHIVARTVKRPLDQTMQPKLCDRCRWGATIEFLVCYFKSLIVARELKRNGCEFFSAAPQSAWVRTQPRVAAIAFANEPAM